MFNISRIPIIFFYAFLALTGEASLLPFQKCPTNTKDTPTIVVHSIEWGLMTPQMYSLNITAHTSSYLATTNLGVQASALGVHLPSYQIQLCNQTTYQGASCAFGDFRVGLHVQKSLMEQYLPSHIPLEVELTVSGLDENHLYISSCVETEVIPETGIPQTCPYLQENHYKYLFHKWGWQHAGRIPTQKETNHYLPIFKKHTEAILAHNSDGSQTFSMGHNQFSLLTNEMYREVVGLRSDLFLNQNNDYFTPTLSSEESPESPESPVEVDWRLHGAVTPVKNQGQCGSCWSFSTTGALEGAYAIKYSKLVSFSEQELVDCDSSDDGCDGGLMDNAFRWIRSRHGLCSDENYPYTSGEHQSPGSCQTCLPVPNSTIQDIVDVDRNENALMKAVAQQPVSIAIEADKLGFQLYRKGIYSGDCGQKLDHGVLVVGYGEDYWIVKNSWGPTWGDRGYIKIAKGNGVSGGECGILLSASYPTL